MKLLIVLCCVVSVSLAFSGMFNRRESTPSVAEVIQKTTSMVNKRTIEKRTDDVQLAFRWIDTDDNSHISGEEFSTFYANANIPGLTYSKSEWTTMFNQAMTLIDTNGNNQLEMGEFRKLAAMGMGK